MRSLTANNGLGESPSSVNERKRLFSTVIAVLWKSPRLTPVFVSCCAIANTVVRAVTDSNNVLLVPQYVMQLDELIIMQSYFSVGHLQLRFLLIIAAKPVASKKIVPGSGVVTINCPLSRL